MSKVSMGRIIFLSVLIVFQPFSLLAKTKLKNLKITTQIPSWVEQKEITQKFSPKELFEIINGGADEYVDHGLVEGIHQQFTTKDGKTVEIFAEDFKTAEKSSAMFTSKKEGYSKTTTISTLLEIQNFSYKGIGAIIVVATLKNFYIELIISGYADETEAEKTAVTFLSYYKQRMKK